MKIGYDRNSFRKTMQVSLKGKNIYLKRRVLHVVTS